MSYVQEKEDTAHAREGRCEPAGGRRGAARQQARRVRVREGAAGSRPLVRRGERDDFAVDLLRLSNGTAPFEDYLEGMSEKMQAKTLRSLQLLREFGPMLREPNTKPLGDGVFELRTNLGNDTGRTLFFFLDGRSIVVTHGFIK